jgi:hypothetical protein
VTVAGKTQAGGAFTLDAAPLSKLKGPVYAFVTAYQPGLALDQVHPTDLGQPVLLTLVPAAPFTGKMENTDGQPLAGVEVRLDSLSYPLPGGQHWKGIALAGDLGRILATKTNETGEFAMRLGPRDASFMFTFSAPGYGTVRTEVPPSWPVRLVKAGTLRGRLVYPPGVAPAAGVRVILSGQMSANGLESWASPLTDATGAFGPVELPAGGYFVDLQAQPPGEYLIPPVWSVEVRAGRETTVELTAEKGAPVTGRVVAADTGAGLEGIEVTVAAINGSITVTTKTGLGGSFRLLGPVGDVQVRVQDTPDYYRADGNRGNYQTVPLTAAGADVGEIMMNRTVDLTVLVVDQTGRPVQGATVTSAERHYGAEGPPTTSSEGLHIFTHCRPSEPMTFRARKGELSSEAVKVQVGPVRLVLKPGLLSQAQAVLVDQDGHPLPQAQAYLSGYGDGTNDSFRAVPDAEGRVVWTDLWAGWQYWLSVYVRGGAPVQAKSWTAVGGKTEDLGVVPVTLLRGVVAGTVLDEKGRPVAEARVWVDGDDSRPVQTVTDSAGRFRLEHLKEGNLFLFATAPRHLTIYMPADTGQTDLRIAMRTRQPATMGPPQHYAGPSLPPAEGRAQAEALLQQALHEARPPEYWNSEAVIRSLARLDPAAGIRALTTGHESEQVWVNPKASYGEAGYLGAAEGSLATDFSAAEKYLRETEPGAAVSLLLSKATALRITNPDLARKCADLSLDLTSGISDANHLLMARAEVASTLEEMGDPRGPALAKEVYEQVKARPLEGTGMDPQVRGRAAYALAPVDPEGAVALLAPPPKWEDGARELKLSARWSVARAIARRDLDRGVRVLEGLTPDERDRGLVAIVGELAPAQWGRAQDLLDQISEPTEEVLAEIQLANMLPPDQARGMIDQAAEQLRGMVGGWGAFGYSVPDAFVALACVARRRGYDGWTGLAAEAAAAPPTEGWIAMAAAALNDLELEHLHLLAFVAPDVARLRLERFIDAAGGPEKVLDWNWRTMLSAAAEISPDWATQMWLRHRPKDDLQGVARSSVTQITDVLLHTPEQRETAALQDFLPREGYW